MVCVIPFFAGDVRQALRLLRWIGDLGGCPGHDCLLVADADTPWPQALECKSLAMQSFLATDLITNGEHIEGWIPGSNSLFKAAAQFAQDRGQSFLFLEPDAVPLAAGWLDSIEAEYKNHIGRYLGSLVYHDNPTWPNPYFEGVGVYPWIAWPEMKPHFRTDVSWTRACAPAVVPKADNNPLFQHLWGEQNNPPRFARQRVPGTALFDLGQLKTGAVLFHRQKDGSLIRLLREKRGLADPETESRLVVVLPFCNMDGRQFIRTLDWALELDGRLDYDCLLSYEEGTIPQFVQGMFERAKRLFRRVTAATYPRPGRGVWAPTWAFVHAARAVCDRHNGPWLWWEYDMIPLQCGWLAVLELEYQNAGKDFMGPIVPGQGHMNGTGIYPADTPLRLSRAFRDLGTAWDVAMKPEMIQDCHDCGRLLQHVWTVDRAGRFLQHGDGAEPTFRNQQAMAQIFPTAVCLHRSKDGTLIQRLRERKKRCEPTSSLSPVPNTVTG